MENSSLKFIPFHVPLIEDGDIKAVTDTLKGGWITTGPKVKEFEEAFAKYLGARHAVAVSSCTAALHLALEAIGLKEGDEVLLPTLTFTASAEVVAYFNAKPVLVDIEANKLNLDVDAAARKITARTRALIPVHFAGQPCDLDSLGSLAESRRLTVVEDAAHALPAKYKGRKIGTCSSLTAFSFYATKPLTTGEGGMVTTEDEAFADRVSLMRLHGMSRDAWKRYSAEGSWRYEVLDAGFKYNMTDLQASLGLSQLAKCDAMWQRRAAIASRYTASLSELDAYRIPKSSPEVKHAWHLYVIQIEPEVLSIQRDATIEELRGRGIGTAVHFIPLHLHPYYQRRWGYRPGQFPVAENYFAKCISLPIYPGMTNSEVERVITALREIATKYRR